MIGPVESNLDNTKNTKITHFQNFSFIQTLMSLFLLLRSLKVTETTTNTRRKAEFVNLLYTKKSGGKLAIEYSLNILSTS